jgi:ABC-type sugar transport system permease subunit
METTTASDPRRAGARLAYRRRTRRARATAWPLAFISPFFILFGLFFVYPLVFSGWLSFREWPGLGPKTYVGLTNYRDLFHDSLFWHTMLNAVILFFLYVPVMTLLAVVFASVLNSGFVRLQGIWRALLFLPTITSMVAAGYTFKLIFSTDSGIANHALSQLGLGHAPWLDSIWWARVSVAILMIWAWLGYNTVIMLAGLQTIPLDVLDAAKVDGAGPVAVFRRITLPLLRPQIVFAVTLSIIGTFSMFTEPYVLTQGGPVQATTTPVMDIFQTTFANLQFGYAAAMSYVYFGIIVVITVAQFMLLSRGDTAPRRA